MFHALRYFAGPYGNHGCSKGQMEVAFEYAIDMGGLDTEDTYPYEGTQGKCRFNKSKLRINFSLG